MKTELHKCQQVLHIVRLVKIVNMHVLKLQDLGQ